LLLSARVVLSRYVRPCIHAFGPKFGLTHGSVFTNILRAKDVKNVEMSRHMGVGDIETHTDRPRCFWGIGSRLGHPSNHQNRPRARSRNHITASRTMFHAPACVHVGEIPPSFDGITQKQNARGRGGERDGYGGGGGACGVFLHTRDPHSPSCGHFHTHFQKTQISRNTGMRNKRDEGWAKQWRWWWEDKTSRPMRM
jgi:hypothetical protein